MDRMLELALSNAATATALALVVVLMTLRRKQPTLAYILWLAVLIRLLFPPLVEIGLLPTASDATSAVASTSWTGAVTAIQPAMVEPASSNLPQIVLGLWLAGSAVVLLIGTARTLRFRRLLVAAESPSSDLTARLENMSERLGLRRPPRVLTVAEPVPPMLWSLLGSTRMILPEDLLNRLTRPETDALLGHELAHLKRRDHWVRHLELAAVVLFWWHPVAWWTVRRIHASQELCCDQTVAQLLPDRRRAYADCLVKTAAFLAGTANRRMVAASPMADLRELKGRIKMIMTSSTRRAPSMPVRAGVALTVLFALTFTPVLIARTADTDGLRFSGEPIDLVLDDARLSDVLAQFSKLVPDIEILVEPGVEGSVSANFAEVPWDEALHRILVAQGLEYTLEGRLLIVRRGAASVVEPVAVDAVPRIAGRYEGQDVFRYVESEYLKEPVVVHRVDPRYPEQARRDKVQGTVVLDALIDASGAVRDVSVLESPSDELSRAAIAAVEQWIFDAAVLDGEAVSVRYNLTIRFRLQ